MMRFFIVLLILALVGKAARAQERQCPGRAPALLDERMDPPATPRLPGGRVAARAVQLARPSAGFRRQDRRRVGVGHPHAVDYHTEPQGLGRAARDERGRPARTRCSRQRSR